MKTTLVVAGIVILVVGLGILVYGLYATSNNSTTTEVVPQTQRSIDGGGSWVLGMNLKSGETLTGTAQISSYNSSAGPVFLYIQNESAYIYWGGCMPCTLPSSGYVNMENYTVPSSGVQTFTWTAPYTGAFYFIFDNENYNQNTQASASIAATVPSTTHGNSTLVFAGLAVVVVGIIVAIAAASMSGSPKPPKPPAPATTTTSPSSAAPT